MSNEFQAPPLDKDQVEYAHEQLEDLHPLAQTKLQEAFPWLGVATCYKKDQVSEASDNYTEGNGPIKNKTVKINGKEVVKKQVKPKKNPIDGAVVAANPLAKLGFGIVAYMNMLWMLIWTFTIYTLILLPTMFFYMDGTAYDSVPNAVKSSYLDTYLGNLGYSSVQCASIPTNVGRLNIDCPFGTIGSYLDWGINAKSENKNICVTGKTNSDCTPDADFIQTNLDSAIGEPDHLFEFSDVPALFKGSTPSGCDTSVSNFFVQYTCVQSTANMQQKYNQIALAAATGVLICFVFTVSIRAQFQGGKIQQIEWDVTTVTAGDFSVEFTITEKAYNTWKKEVFQQNDAAPAFVLKQQIKDEVEKNLDDWIKKTDEGQEACRQLYGKGKKTSESMITREYGTTKVADIVFSFNNAKLIDALRTRGGLIASQDWKNLEKQEEKVNDLFQEFESLTVPTTAFITFESDDSANLALDVTGAKESHNIIGQEMKFSKPSEPTDIIWENRHYSKFDYLYRQLFAAIVIGILLFGSLILIYAISAWSAKLAAVYPPVSCSSIQNAYGNKLMVSAVDDYNFIQENPGQPSSGCLQCWCQQQLKDDPDGYLTREYDISSTEKEPICEEYANDASSVYFWTSALSYLLIGINYILRTVCIMMVDWIGYPTETERLSKTTTVTFIVQYFNSAFLLLMVNANMEEQPITFWLTTGAMPDFNTIWFRSVGDIIVAAMVFNIWYPIIEIFGYAGLRLLSRCLDRGCCIFRSVKADGSPNTKSTSIQGYINVWMGPVYFMHFKYSSILTIVYITFMYGFGMPVLFPIALFSFIVLYLVEKYALFYVHITPPMYDERLSNDVLNKLQFAPLLYLIFGYWMASSQQLLSNDYLTAKATSTDTYITQHTMGGVFSDQGWDGIKWPMMVAFIILNIVWYFGNILQTQLYKCFSSLQIGDIEINEDIDNYWVTLDEEDRKWSIKEEENNRNELKMNILTEDQFNRLCDPNNVKEQGNKLQGVHSYDILANPLYLDDFQYVTAAEDDRADMIIDNDTDEGNDAAQSDLVRVALNLAFIPESKARKFKFGKNFKASLDGKMNSIQ